MNIAIIMAKTAGSFMAICKDIPARNNANNAIIIFSEDNILIHLSLK